jgi:hypothetical protein
LRHAERAEGETPGEFRVDHFVNVRFWHEADIKQRPLFGRYGVESGHHWLVMSISAFDRYC